MSELPEGWISIELAEAVAPDAPIQYGILQPGPDTPGGVPYVRPTEIRDDRIEVTGLRRTTRQIAEKYRRSSLKAGDVVLSIVGSIGKVAIVPPMLAGANITQSSARLRPRTGLVSTSLMACFLRSPLAQEQFDEVELGTGVPRLNIGDIRRFTIPIPPFAEQKRIVAKVEELLAQVNAARERLARVPAILKRFRQAVLAAACDGRLTEEWREEHLRDGDWPWIVLGSALEGSNYGSASKSSLSGRVPVLRMGNIQDGRLDWDDLVYTSDPAEIKKYRLSAGDVLFNRTNSPELVGKTAVYRGERDAIFAGYLIRVRCTDQLLPDYLNYCLNSPAGRDYLMQVKTDGVSQSNINAKKLAAFEFGLPDVNEQEEIVRRVETLFKVADAIEKHLAAATVRAVKLTQAILAKAFRGELVPTEAELSRREGRTYESGAALLVQIGGEREGNDTKADGRSRRAIPEGAAKRARAQVRRWRHVDP